VVIEEFLKFVSTDVSIVVLVQSLESFVLIKQRSSVQLLSDAFRVSEVANDSLQCLLQQVDGFISEDLVQRNIISVGRSSVVQDFSIAGILGGQDFAESSESQDTFIVSVVLLQQEGDLIVRWEDSELVEGFLDFVSTNKGLSFNVKELEGIQEVEVSSDGEVNLNLFQVLVEVDLLVKGIGKVLFFVTLHWGESSNWASGGGGSSVWASNTSSWGLDSGSAEVRGTEFSFEVSSVWAGNLLGGFSVDSRSSEVVSSGKSWGS